jgi:hypothetical protein
MSMNFNWPEIAKSKKGVRTSDGKACGDVVAEAGNTFFVIEGAIKEYRYRIPKSKVANFNGSEVTLILSDSELSNYREEMK